MDIIIFELFNLKPPPNADPVSWKLKLWKGKFNKPFQ